MATFIRFLAKNELRNIVLCIRISFVECGRRREITRMIPKFTRRNNNFMKLLA